MIYHHVTKHGWLIWLLFSDDDDNNDNKIDTTTTTITTTTTPIEKRICLACDDNLLESEYHFVIHCNAYRKTRTDFFQEIVDNTDLPVYGSEPVIMKTLLDKSVTRITGRYLERMFAERKSMLFNQTTVEEEDDCSMRDDQYVEVLNECDITAFDLERLATSASAHILHFVTSDT